MRVILIRHYKTQSNKEGRILGWGDSPPYPNWMKNINIIDAGLRENGVNLDAVYSSDLERSYQTARVYAASFGIAEVGQPQLSPGLALGTVALLGLIGLVAGYFPARTAANLDPVVAMKL